MDSLNTAFEPESYSVYIIFVILSLLVFIGASGTLLFILHLFYRDWKTLVNRHQLQLVQEDSLNAYERTDWSGQSDVHLENDNITESTGNYPDIIAKIATIKQSKAGTSEKKVFKVVEISPPKFLQSDEKMRNPGLDKELGKLSFLLEYYSQSDELHISKIKGEGLRKQDTQDILNPFISIYVWPDSQSSIKTKVMRKTNTATWEELIVMEQFQHKNMADKALYFKVQSWNQLKGNDVIGHVVLPLKVIDNFTNETYSESFVKNIQPELNVNRGSIKVMLMYDSIKEELHITIVKAKITFPTGFIADQCQVFIRIDVDHPSMHGQKASTSIQRGTFQPVWNEEMIFKTPKEKFNKMNVTLSLRQEGFSKKGKSFGRVELSLNADEADATHLKAVQQYTNIEITRWHQIISHIL